MGFLKFCSILLNMVCGYPTGKDCVICSGSLAFGCVLSTWVLLSIGFSFARTSLCCRDGYYWGFWENMAQYSIIFGLISSVFFFFF